MILRIILMAASCPSNKAAAVTIRILFFGVYFSTVSMGSSLEKSANLGVLSQKRAEIFISHAVKGICLHGNVIQLISFKVRKPFARIKKRLFLPSSNL